VRYPKDEAQDVLAMIKAMNFSEVGIGPTESGPKFDGRVE
jgi:hypothetical protein